MVAAAHAVGHKARRRVVAAADAVGLAAAGRRTAGLAWLAQRTPALEAAVDVDITDK